MLRVRGVELVLAWPLPHSIGTFGCIREARKLGLRVLVWGPDGAQEP